MREKRVDMPRSAMDKHLASLKRYVLIVFRKCRFSVRRTLQAPLKGAFLPGFPGIGGEALPVRDIPSNGKAHRGRAIEEHANFRFPSTGTEAERRLFVLKSAGGVQRNYSL
jgi:hypothetical protein